MKDLFFRSPIEIFTEITPGIVEVAIAPRRRGRIKFLSSYWPAKFYQIECSATVLPGQTVDVVGIEGITLLVVPFGCKKPFNCQNAPVFHCEVDRSTQQELDVKLCNDIGLPA